MLLARSRPHGASADAERRGGSERGVFCTVHSLLVTSKDVLLLIRRLAGRQWGLQPSRYLVPVYDFQGKKTSVEDCDRTGIKAERAATRETDGMT